jgi:radical SAM superfamily enzyme YgiQ (UPF0313 family)
MEYHAILLAGKSDDHAGRSIGGFRLRTAAKRIGYDVLVLDAASRMTMEELKSVLKNVITDKTLAFCLSTQWYNPMHNADVTEWLCDDFFDYLKSTYPNVTIVAGGAGALKMPKSSLIYKNTDWFVSGFADESFPLVLKKLDPQENTYTSDKIRYMKVDGKYMVDSDNFHRILVPNNLETVLYKSDNFLEHQPIALEVSRGCIFKCSFCSFPYQGAKSYDEYMRTPENIANELRRNYDLFKTTRYVVMDDTFNDSIEKLDRLERAIELAKLPNFEFVSYIRPELLATKPEMCVQLARMGFRGGLVGIESQGKAARKVIGRGMDIERTFDAIRNLTSQSSKIKMTSSNIVGLPGDTEDDILRYSEYYSRNTDNLFVSWVFTPLNIYHYDNFKKTTDLNVASDIEKDPQKFGYTVGKKFGPVYEWKNEHMDYYKAKQIAKHVNIKYYHMGKTGGWELASGWHVGESDNNMDELTQGHLFFKERIDQSARDRAIEQVKRYT